MEQTLRDWGYVVLFLYSFGGGFLALIAASVMSAAGELNIFLCIALAIVANIIGDQFLFLMARNNKQFADDIFKKHRRQVAYVTILLRKYGSFIIILKKYIYGIKTIVPIAIGISKYQQKDFLIFNSIGAIIWGIVVGSLGYFFGSFVMQISAEYPYVGIGVALSIIAFLYWLNKKIAA